jgi:8-oxo-dGTP diphosphatase
MQVIDVAAGLVFRDGRLLLTQRAAGSHLGGLWEFPGGKREPAETFEDCLARELMEELGIAIAIGPLVESITHAYPEKTVRLNFYRCQWSRHEPQALGCADFRWVARADLGQFQFPPADMRLLERLQQDNALWQD